jgi:hypothetical protein
MLLDLMLPDADGVVLIRAVRRQRLRARVALVTAAAATPTFSPQPSSKSPRRSSTSRSKSPTSSAGFLKRPPTPRPRPRPKSFTVALDLDLLAAQMADETGEPQPLSAVRQWLLDAGFTPMGDRWVVAERELGQLDPSEVLSVTDA